MISTSTLFRTCALATALSVAACGNDGSTNVAQSSGAQNTCMSRGDYPHYRIEGAANNHASTLFQGPSTYRDLLRNQLHHMAKCERSVGGMFLRDVLDMENRDGRPLAMEQSGNTKLKGSHIFLVVS